MRSIWVATRFFLFALLGGKWNYGSYCGAWCLDVAYASSIRYRTIGGRLLYVHKIKISVYP